jgi:hypothetical protein
MILQWQVKSLIGYISLILNQLLEKWRNFPSLIAPIAPSDTVPAIPTLGTPVLTNIPTLATVSPTTAHPKSVVPTDSPSKVPSSRHMNNPSMSPSVHPSIFPSINHLCNHLAQLLPLKNLYWCTRTPRQ